MARIRSIKPEFPQSESMGRVSREARLCFLMLWTLADDEGRLRGNSRMLARTLYPYDDGENGRPETTGEDMDRWLNELTAEDCIIRYQIDGTHYIQIAKWLIHQKIDKPSKSKIPEFDESSRILANPPRRIKDQGKDQGRDRKETSCAEPQSDSTPAGADLPGLVDLDDILSLGDPTEAPTAVPVPLPTAVPTAAPTAAPTEPPAPTAPAVIVMPLAGGKEFGITQGQIDEWAGAYPAVNVYQQLASMRQWCLAKPARRKTQRGVLAFCNGWLMREQDKGGPVARPINPKGMHGNFGNQNYRDGVGPNGEF